MLIEKLKSPRSQFRTDPLMQSTWEKNLKNHKFRFSTFSISQASPNSPHLFVLTPRRSAPRTSATPFARICRNCTYASPPPPRASGTSPRPTRSWTQKATNHHALSLSIDWAFRLNGLFVHVGKMLSEVSQSSLSKNAEWGLSYMSRIKNAGSLVSSCAME